MTVTATQGQRRFRIRRLTVDEYHRMIERGVIPTDERVELLEGVLHEMTPKGPRHAESLRRLLRTFFREIDEEVAHVRAQDPVTIPAADSEPEPDIALVVPRDGGYAVRHPYPGEVLLLVEIAESSLDEDPTEKGPLYAGAGIPEYWTVNLADDQLEVYREPKQITSDGATYHQRLLYGAGDRVAPNAFPACVIDVASIFP